MQSYYITKSGKIKRENNTIVLDTRDGKITIPVENIDTLNFFSEIEMNKEFIEFLSQKGIVANFFNYYGNYMGSYWPKEKNISGDILIQQVQAYLSNRRIEIAKEIVRASIYNLELDDSDAYISDLENAQTINDIMLIEARARKNYFSKFFEKTSKYFTPYKGRRNPDNPSSALLNFGYSLLYSTVTSEIYKTPLDPRISFLHEPFQSRFALSFDIADIFKPIIVDRLILRLLANNIIDQNSFEINEGIRLKDEVRKKFLIEYSNQLNSTIHHKKLKRKVSYSYLIRLDLYKLMRYLLESEKLSFFTYSRRW